MRLLRFDNIDVDIDSDTAIGVTLQNFDFENPTTIRTAVTNNFSIPKTSKNMKLIEHAGKPFSLSNKIYGNFKFDYFLNNYKIINNGKAAITEINDRINLIGIEKPSFFDNLKVPFFDFLTEFLKWSSLPVLNSEVSESYTDFVGKIGNDYEHVSLHISYSNFNTLEIDDEFLDKRDQTKYLRTENANGGMFQIKLKHVFEFIEDFFEQDLGVREVFEGNLFNDTVFNQITIPARNININQNAFGWHFEVLDLPFLPFETTKDYENLTLYDLFSTTLRVFNCILDFDFLKNKYFIRKLDNIENAEVVNFSKNIDDKYSFYPLIENIKQNNYITFSDAENPIPTSKYFKCENKNIEIGNIESAFTINAFVPEIVNFNNKIYLDFTNDKCFSNFTFMIKREDKNIALNCVVDFGGEHSTIKACDVNDVYGLQNEYNQFAKMVQYPKVYKIRKKLNINDIHNLEFFKMYYVQKLNGYFFLSKILNFNPQGKDLTEIELIKIK